jgi:hypothetical protein
MSLRRIVTIVVMMAVSPALEAGKLKSFEQAPNSSSSKSSSGSSSSSSSDVDAALGLLDFFFFLFSQPSVQSTPSQSAIGDAGVAQSEPPEKSGNMHGATQGEVNQNLRKGYSFALPNVRVDGIYFYDPDGINAFRFKGEGGFLLLGADVDYTRFYEGADRLNNMATHALIRLPLARELMQMDIALGYRRIWGTQVHQGFDLGFPFYINFGRWAQMDFKYYVTLLGDKRPIQEVDVGLAGKYKWVGARAGYRYIKTKGADAIQGPEVGLFFQW